MGESTTTDISTLLLGDDGYGQEVATIQANIQATRLRIESNLQALEEEVTRRFDAARWIRNHPHKAVGLAFALGLYVGLK